MKHNIPNKSKKIEPILKELKQILTNYYGERLAYLILYGSYARGDFNQDSDIDVLVVLENCISENKEIDIITDLKTDLCLDNEIFISTNPTTSLKFETSNYTYFRNIKKQGIIL